MKTSNSSGTIPFGRLVLVLAMIQGLVNAQLLVAAPQGAQVVAGQANVAQQGATTTITAGHNSVIQYQSFNVGPQETVRFVQPGPSARVLNRVTGFSPSVIEGALHANGIVYLVNPSGVYFRDGAVVDVGRLYAAASSISNADFLAGIDRFTDAQGAVINRGTIRGDAIYLIGRQVANYGTVVAPDGAIALVAGKDVYLGQANSRIMVRVEGGGAPEGEAGVTQAGTLDAGKGQIFLGAGDVYSMAIHSTGTAAAQDITLQGTGPGEVRVEGRLDASDTAPGSTGGTVKVLGDKVALVNADIDASGSASGGQVLIGGGRQGQDPTVPNASGVWVSPDTTVRADATVGGDGGEVIVYADSVARVYGQLSAQGAGAGTGGFIETSGKQLVVTQTPTPGAGGTWLIDPENIEITGATANITQGGAGDPGPITFGPAAPDTPTTIDVAAIDAALDAGSNVIIDTASAGAGAGTITVTSPILKSADGGSADGSVLTLNADHDIIVNNTITSTAGALDLVLAAGRTTGGFVDINAAITTNGGSFTASGSYFDSTGGTITTAGGLVSVTTTAGATTSTIGATLDAGSGSVTFNSVGPLTQASGIGVTGSGVSYTVTGAANSLTIAGPVTAPAGDISFVSANTILLFGVIATTDGSIFLRADSDGTAGADTINMFGGTITAGGAGRSVTLTAPDVSLGGTVTGENVNLYPSTVGRSMTIGHAVAGTLALDDAEMNRITVPAGGVLTIGSDALNQTGTITIHSVTSGAGAALEKIDGGIVINADGAGGTVTFTGGYTHTDGDATPTLTVNARNINANGNVSQKGDLTWNADTVTFAGNRTVTSTHGNLSFQPNGGTLTLQAGTSVVDTLGLTATAGSVTVNGTILPMAGGGSSNVVTVTGPGGVTLAGVGASGDELGSLVIGAASGLTTLSANIYTNTLQDYSAASEVRINGAIRLDTDSGNGSITFGTKNITRTNASDTLTVDYGTGGTLTLAGVGAAGAELASFTIDNGSGATGTATIAGDLYAGAIDLRGPGANGVVLSGALRFDADHAAGDINLQGTPLRGAGASITLDVDSASAIYLNAVGAAGSELASLVIDSTNTTGRAVLAGNLYANAIDLRGPGANGIQFAGSLRFDADAGAGDINLSGAPLTRSTGSDTLTLAAQGTDTISLGAIGTDAAPLVSLVLDAGSTGPLVLGGSIYANTLNVSTATAITVNGAVRLDADGGAGALNLGSAAIARTAGSDTLTLAAQSADTITLGGLGSSGAEFAAFTVETGRVSLSGDVYAGAITLANLGATGLTVSGNRRFDADHAAGAINLSGTTLARTGAGQTLTFVTDSASAITLGTVGTGAAEFAALTIGAGSGQTRLTGNVFANAMDFSGSGARGVQVSGAAILLDADAAAGAINFTGTPITAALPSTTTLTLDTDGASTLTLDQVGTDATPLAGLVNYADTDSASGQVILTNSIHANAINLSGAAANGVHISAGGVITLDADGGVGNINLVNTPITVATDGVDGLILDTQVGDTITLNAVGGPGARLASLTVNAGSGTTNLTATVYANTQTYGGDVLTVNPTSLFGNATFNAGLAPGDVGSVGAGLLTVNGNLTFGAGAVLTVNLDGTGAGTSYDQIEVLGGTIDLGGATLAGTVGTVYASGADIRIIKNTAGNPIVGQFANGGSVTLTGSGGFDSQSFAINYAVTASNHLELERISTYTWTGGGGDDLWSTGANWNGGVPVTGATLIFDNSTQLANTNDLALEFGSIVFAATAGAFTLGGTGISLIGGITNNSAETITINFPITLTGPQVFNAAGGRLVFGGAINGNQALTLAGAGGVTLASVGQTTPLGSLTVNAGSGTTRLGGNVSAGTQTYNVPVLLAADVTLTGAAAFKGTIDGTTAGQESLSITGSASFGDGAGDFIGSAVALQSLAVTGSASFAGGNAGPTNTVTTVEGQTYGGLVTLGASTTLDGSTVSVNGGVNGAGQALTIHGDLVVGDGLGDNITNVSTLAVLGATTINTGAITTTGAQSYTGAVTLGTGVTLTGTTPTFTAGVIGGGFDLTLNFSGTTVISAAGFTGIQNLVTGNGGATEISGAFGTTGTQIYNDAVTLTGDTTLTGTTVTFNDTVTGGTHALAIAGNAVFGNSAGDTVTGVSTLSVSGTTGITGSAITTSGTQAYTGAVTLGGSTTLTGTTPTFGAGVVGAGNSLTLDFSGTTVIDGAAFTGLLNLATGNGGATQLTGTITTTGTQTYNDAVTLTGDTTVVGTTVTFASAVNSTSAAESLTVTGNAVFQGPIGAGAALEAVTVSGTTSLGATPVITDNSNGTGLQTYTGAVTLTGDVVLIGTGIVFGSTVDGTVAGNQSLTITGPATFGGVVGGVALEALSVSGATAINTTAITTSTAGGGSGNQTFTGAVTLSSDAALTGTTVAFGSTVNGTGDGTESLTITGNASFAGIVGATHPLEALAVSGTTAIHTTAITTSSAGGGSGNQTYTGAVTLSSDAALTAGTVAFGSTVNGTGDGTESLTITGAASFAGVVGGTNPLEALSVSGATAINTSAITTSTAGGGTGNQAFAGLVTLGATTVLTGGTPVFLAGVDGATYGLTLNFTGITDIDGAAFANLASLTTGNGGSTTLTGTVVTTAAQSYNDAVTLLGNTALQGTTVTFNNTVAGGTNSLAITGDAVFGNEAADTVTGLSTLSVSGTTGITGSAITTSGTQSYTGLVTLGGHTTLTGTDPTFTTGVAGGGFDLALSFSGPTTLDGDDFTGIRHLMVNGGGTTTVTGALTTTGYQVYTDAVVLAGDTTLAGDPVAFTSTVNGTGDGTESLTITGNANFGGVVGGTNALKALSVSGTTELNTTAVTTSTAGGGTGNQTYAGAVALGNDVTLTGATMAFGSTVNSSLPGTEGLAIAGAASFAGVVGGTNPLEFLTVSGTTALNTTAITTSTAGGGTGNQTYTGAVTLGNSTVLTGGTPTFTAGLDAATHDLTLNFSGTTAVSAAIFSNLGSLTTGGGGTTTVTGTIVTTGPQTYNDAVTLLANTDLQGTTVTLNGATNATASGTETLTITGNAVLAGILGGTTPLGALAVTGTTAINTAGVTTGTAGGGTGNQTYGDTVTLGAHTTLTGVTPVFGMTVDGGGVYDLTLAFSGTHGVSGAVLQNIRNLTANNGGWISLASITTTGTQTYSEMVNLVGDVTLTGTLVTFGSTLEATTAGMQSLTITGNASFGGAVGGIRPLESLAVSGTALLNSSVTTSDAVGGTGAQTYGGAVQTGSNVTLTGTTITFNDDLAVNGTSPGTLTIVGDFVLGVGGTVDLTLNGLTPGTEHDQIVVTGGVDLSSATTPLRGTAGASYNNDDALTIIDNDGGDAITNVPAAIEVTISGQKFDIDYAGPAGAGNDVVIVRAGALITWIGGGTTDNWNDAGNWDLARIPALGDTMVFAGTTRLTSVNDLAGLSLAGLQFSAGAGAFVLSGNAITLGGGVTNNSASTQTINLAIALNASQTFDAAAGALVFGGAISGAHTLTLAGASGVTLAAVGTDGTPLTSLLTNASLGQLGLTGNVYANTQNYTNATGVQVSGAAIRLDADGAAGAIDFTGVPLTAAAAGTTTLTLATDGASTITLNTVGASGTELAGLVIEAASQAVLTGNVFANAQNYTGATGVLVNAGAVLTLDADAGAGNIDFTGVDILPNAATDGLALLARTGAGTDTILLANVGTGGSPMASIAASAETVVLNSSYYTDGGSVTLNGAVVLNSSTTIDTHQTADGRAAGAVDLSGAVVSAGAGAVDVTINTSTPDGGAGGAVTLGAFNADGGAHANLLAVNAASGSGTDGAIALGGSIITTTTQTYTGPVTTANGIALTGSTVQFNDTLAVNGASAGTLTVVGNFALGAAGTMLVTINGTAPGTEHDQVVVTGGDVDFNSATTPFAGTVSGSQAVGGTYTIISGPTAVQNAPAAATVTLTSNPFGIDYAGGGGADTVLTRTQQTWTWDGGGADDNWSTSANWTSDAGLPGSGDILSFVGNTRLAPTNDLTGLSLASITFPGAGGLFVLGGNAITLTGGISNTSGSLKTVAMPITLGAATVTFNSTTFLNVTGGITGAQTLALTGAGHNIGLGAVGTNGTPLTALTTAGGGQVTLQGDVYANAMDFTGTTNVLVNAGGVITLDADGGAGNIDFTGVSVGPQVAGTDGMVLLARTGAGTDTITLGTVDLASLSATAETIGLTGNLRTEGGNITLAGDVVLGASVTLDTLQTPGTAAGAVDLSGAAVSASGAGSDLIIDTSTTDGQTAGDVTLGTLYAVGGANVNALTVTTTSATGTGGTIMINGSLATTAGQTYNGVVATANGITLTGTTVQFNDQLAVNYGSAGTLNIAGNFALGVTGTILATIHGPTAGTQYDQIRVTGNVDLGSATTPIDASVNGSHTVGNTYTLIDNQGANPIANEPAVANATYTNNPFSIAYNGGTGNDLVLTRTQQTWTWDGGGMNTNWSTSANWTSNAGVPGGGDNLSFAGAGGTANNDLTGLSLDTITFEVGGGAFVLSGNAITLTGGILNNSAATNTVNLPITLGNGVTIDAAAGPLDLGASISAAQALTLTATNAITVSTLGTNATPLASLTVGGGGAVILTGDVFANAMDFTGAGSVVLDAGGVLTLDADGGAGNINFGTVGIVAQTPGVDGLILLADSGADTIILSNIGVGGALASLAVTAQNITVGSTWQTDGGPVTLSGVVTLTSNSNTIDTHVTADGRAAGAVDLSAATFTADAGARDLTIDASTPDGGAGGAVTLGLFNSSGGANVNALTVTSTSGSGTDGAITIGQNVSTTAGQTYTGPVATANGITLTGSTVQFNDTLAVNGASAGTLSVVGNFALGAAGTIDVTLNNTTAGTGYDQIGVTGGVDLNTAATPFSGTAGAFVIGDAFTVIANDGADAVANPSAAASVLVSGQTFAIDYAGDTGNDVVLTRDVTTLTWDGGGLDDNWSTVANWVGDLVIPGNGDVLFFAGSTRLTPYNDLVGLTLNTIVFSPGGGSFTLSGNAISLDGEITSNSAAINTVNFDVALTGAVTHAFRAPGGGRLIIGGSVTGAANLNIVSIGGVTLNSVGTVGTPLTSLTSIAGSGQTILNGNVFATAQTFNAPLGLGGDVNLTGTTVAFNNTVTGNGHGLTVTGAAAFGNDAADAITGVSDLAVTGATTITTGTVTTTGTQTYTGLVTLAGNTTLAGTTGTFTTGVAGAGNDLALNFTGTAVVDGAKFANIANLTTGGAGTTQLTGNITTTAAQVYGDNVELLSDVILDGTTVTFGGAVVGGGHAVAIPNNAVLGDDAADAITGVSTLAVTGATTITAGAITTTGTQTYTGLVTLAGNTTLAGTTGTFTTGVAGAGNDLALNFTGTTVVDGATFANIANLSTGGGGTTQLTGDITTTGTQVYGENVELLSNVNLDGTTVTFGGTVLGNAHSLAIAHDAVFNGSAGQLTSLTVSGATSISAANPLVITTTGPQTYTGLVTLGQTVVLTGTDPTFTTGLAGANHDVSLNFSGPTVLDGAKFTGIRNLATGNTGATQLTGTLTTSGTQTYGDAVTLIGAATLVGSQVSLNNTVTGGGNSLDVTGNAVLGNAVSGVSTLAVTGTTLVAGAAVTTTGAQTYGGPVTLDATTTLTGTTVALSGGVVGAGYGLNVAGNAVFGNTVSGVSTLSVTGATSVNTASIATTGTQQYTGLVTLGNDATLAGTTPTFSGGVDGGGHSLALNFTGTTTIDGAAFVNLAHLSTGTGGATHLSGSLATTGSQTYGNAVTLTGFTSLVGTAVAFNGSLTAAGETLELRNTAGTTFAGTTTLGTVDLRNTPAGQTIAFQGDTVLGALLTAGTAYNVAFTGNSATVTGATALLNTGLVTLGSAAGGVYTFTGGLSTTGNATNPSQMHLGGVVRTSGTAMTLGPINVVANSTLDTTNNGAVPAGAAAAFASADSDTPGAYGLTVNAGASDVTMTSAAGAARALANLSILGRSLTLHDVTTAGDQSYSATDTITLRSSYLATAGGIAFNTNRAAAPDVATIFRRDAGNVTLRAQTVAMSRNDKLTVPLGDLTIEGPGAGVAATSVRLGDLNANGDIVVRSGSTTFLGRPAGSVRTPSGTATDSGVDVVASGHITFLGGLPTVEAGPGGGNTLEYGSPFLVTNAGAGTPRRYTPTDGEFAFGTPVTIADLVPSGPVNIAGVNPTVTVWVNMDIAPAPLLTPALRELLKQLGIFARDPSSREAYDAATSFAVYNDIPTSRIHLAAGMPPVDEALPPDAYQVVSFRLASQQAQEAADSYSALFWTETVDPQSGETQRVYRADELRGALQDALDAYLDTLGDDEDVRGPAWRAWLAQNDPQGQALQVLNHLRDDLFPKLAAIGLNSLELRNSRKVLLRPITPDGISLEEMEAAVYGVAGGGAPGGPRNGTPGPVVAPPQDADPQAVPAARPDETLREVSVAR